MKALLAGAGALEALRPGTRGTVLASFSRACYLDLPGGLVALVGPNVHPGPLHVVLDGPVPWDPGAPVSVREGELLVGQQRVDLGGMKAWIGALPSPAPVRAAAPLICDALEEAAGSSALLTMRSRPTAGELAQRGAPGWTLDSLEWLGVGDLEAGATLLGGLGPGLTPAGDDVLAGAMFGLRVASGPAVEATLAPVAAGLPTGRISLAFLVWAARGQALAPVHDLLATAVREDSQGAAAAARALAGVGASSGADFALGLWSILTTMTASDSQ